MTRLEAYKTLLDAQKYLKYQDLEKFPRKAKKRLPLETLKALATLEAALQVDYQMCPTKRVIASMERLKRKDKTSRSALINSTIDECIKTFKNIMKDGVDK